MRIFLGFLIAGLALGAALWIHGAKLDGAVCRGVVPGDAKGRIPCSSVGVSAPGRRYVGGDYVEHGARRYGWQDPVAVVIAFAGVGAGVALVVSSVRTRREAL